MGIKTKEIKATYKKWQKLNINLDKYLCAPCEIDEELYNYLGEIVPPQYCFNGFVQLGECKYSDNFGTEYYMSASFVNGRYYYLGILPQFKQKIMKREFKKRRFAYCSEGYTINGIGFDKGYIQELEEGELFFENSNWRYATDSEVKDFHSTPYSYQAKGGYFTNKCNDY